MMASFDEIKAGVRLKGLDAAGIAEVVSVSRFGPDALNLVFRVDGRVGERLVYRGEESAFEFIQTGRAYAFDADGSLLRLASEAYRIRLAYLFDPYLAVNASQIEALPHQITAVYGEMLPRQPLRFLLADDPGAGKTVMAGLLIKELLIRGDLERCLIVAPGGLVEQWQDEMAEKFGLGFEILTRDQIEASITGNPFVEKHRLILRLDMAARSDDLKAKLEAAPDWDLIICDEAHRMTASYFGGEVKETQRHKLGKLLGTRTRNFLLMSATPHNGKEADFQLFMGLLDADRFEGRFREGVHKADVTDMMRRLTKEELYHFDGTPLFPERRAYTASYELSPREADLYQAVTTYVREEMNRADRTGDDKRRMNVGLVQKLGRVKIAEQHIDEQPVVLPSVPGIKFLVGGWGVGAKKLPDGRLSVLPKEDGTVSFEIDVSPEVYRQLSSIPGTRYRDGRLIVLTKHARRLAKIFTDLEAAATGWIEAFKTARISYPPRVSYSREADKLWLSIPFLENAEALLAPAGKAYFSKEKKSWVLRQPPIDKLNEALAAIGAALAEKFDSAAARNAAADWMMAHLDAGTIKPTRHVDVQVWQ